MPSECDNEKRMCKAMAKPNLVKFMMVFISVIIIFFHLLHFFLVLFSCLSRMSLTKISANEFSTKSNDYFKSVPTAKISFIRVFCVCIRRSPTRKTIPFKKNVVEMEVEKKQYIMLKRTFYNEIIKT